MRAGLIVADDLTGACDTGHAFAERGYRTRVCPRAPGTNDGANVLVVNTDSRYVDATIAAENVSEATESHPSEFVYKKIDSTLRGNLLAEIMAALDAIARSSKRDSVVAVVAPASPQTGRTTACGYHLVDGRLVTETEVGRDPEMGASEPHLPTLLADTRHAVAHLGIETVANGPESVRNRLNSLEAAIRIVVCDATHDDHLAAIATGARDADIRPLYVGSAGLARHVSVVTEARAENLPSPTPVSTAQGVLAVVGSTAPPTLAALSRVPASHRVVVDSEDALVDPTGTAHTVAETISRRLGRGEQVAVSAAVDQSTVDRTLAKGNDLGLSPRQTGERIAETLGDIVSRAIESAPPRGFVVTGGDTAMATLNAIDVEAIELSGESIDAGIPMGVIEGGSASGSAVITKAGGFGDESTLVACLDRLASI